MLTKVYMGSRAWVEATTITVEVNTDLGVGYHLVGLPDNAIKESNYRIAAALQNNGYKIPGKNYLKHGSCRPTQGGLCLRPYLWPWYFGLYRSDFGTKTLWLIMSLWVSCLWTVPYNPFEELFLLPSMRKGRFQRVYPSQAECKRSRYCGRINRLRNWNHYGSDWIFNEGKDLTATKVDMQAEFYEHLENPEFDFLPMWKGKKHQAVYGNCRCGRTQHHTDWTSGKR